MAQGGVGYFGAGYWALTYWHPDYWAEIGVAPEPAPQQDAPSGGTLSPGEAEFLRRLGQPAVAPAAPVSPALLDETVAVDTAVDAPHSPPDGDSAGAAGAVPPGMAPPLSAALDALKGDLTALYLQQEYAAQFLAQALADRAAEDELAVLLMLLAVCD